MNSESTYSNYTIIIPTYNEGKNIPILLKQLFELYTDLNVIVADDESTDGTQDAVRKYQTENNLSEPQLKLLERVDASDKGITASVVDAAQQITTIYMGVMDGDLQHPPEILGKLVEAHTADKDLVIGARIPYKENQGIHRILVTRFATFIAKLALLRKGYRVSDPMSGFFVCKSDIFKETIKESLARFELRGYKILFDFLRLSSKKLSFDEVLYNFAFRSEGQSKLRPAHALYFVRSLFK